MDLIQNYIDNEEEVIEIQVRDYVRIDTVKPYQYNEKKKVYISRYFKYHNDIGVWLSSDVRVDII